MTRFLAPLALGVVLGGSAAWFALRPPTSGSTPVVNHGTPVVAWSWRDSATPPALAPAPASAAIAAWQALRAPGGAPADFARRADALRVLLVRLPSTGFPRLLDGFGDGKLSDDDRALRQIAFAAWTESDHASAAAWSAAKPDLRYLARQALAAWSVRDPRAAAAWACALSDEPAARFFAALALPALALRDSAAALALASSRGDAFLDEVLPGLLGTLARSDPASAFRIYGPRLWKNGKGIWRLREALGEWAARDPAAALAWIAAQPRQNDDQTGRWLGELAPDGP